MTLPQLIKKYDVPVPRYTSYPTVPYWDTDGFSQDGWWSAVETSFKESNSTKGISIYIHLPFCESLCTYCACNTRITKNHGVEERYVNTVLKEWEAYKTHFHEQPVIREIHLGGGTPTFFSAINLTRLLTGILMDTILHPEYEFSFEGHPNNTTKEQLNALYALGFRRVSFGVQDLDLKVQRAINRIQPLENLKRVVDESREIGYQSISFDLIYGLPYQTTDSVVNTVSKVITLKPDRIAFYSYAHVPWMKPGQRGYEDADLPTDVVKRSLYEIGRELFLNNGYGDVGMDHFALPDDSLSVAQAEGRLHRNFMGYTTNQTDLLIGLGTSSISDAKYAYAQNVKKVEDYQKLVDSGLSPVFKGHIQTTEDLLIRRMILDIACNGEISRKVLDSVADEDMKRVLRNMEAEGIVSLSDDTLRVTSTGRNFVRNICNVLDLRFRRQSLTSSGPVFSRAI